MYFCFISLFSLIIYLFRFNTDWSTFPSLNLSMFTKEDSTAINSEDVKQF